MNSAFTASCSADMSVKLWDFQTFECIRTLQGKPLEVRLIHRKFMYNCNWLSVK